MFLVSDIGSQATGYQKKYTKRKIIFLLLLIVVGMIILLAVKPKRHRPPDTTAPNPPAAPIEEGTVARPLQAEEPDGSHLEGLGAEEDGAPFQILRRVQGV